MLEVVLVVVLEGVFSLLFELEGILHHDLDVVSDDHFGLEVIFEVQHLTHSEEVHRRLGHSLLIETTADVVETVLQERVHLLEAFMNQQLLVETPQSYRVLLDLVEPLS